MQRLEAELVGPSRYGVRKSNGHGMMCPEQEENLKYVINETTFLLNEKYRKGDQEHGGSLIEFEFGALVDHAINEALDQLAYLLTIRRKLQRGGL